MTNNNKKVPEWLNSSVWSTPPPSPPPHVVSNLSDSVTQPPSPPPPPHQPRQNASSFSDSNTQFPVPVSPHQSRQNAVVSSSVNQSPVPVSPRQSASKLAVSNLPVPVSPPRDTDSTNVSASSREEEDDVSRQAQLVQEISRKVINMGELRRLASQGIPDDAGIRATVWKLLLGYLPADRGLWSTELVKRRSQYKHFKEDLLMNPSEITRKLEDSTSSEHHVTTSEDKGLLSRSEIKHGEHPLSLGKSSIWNQFFQDTEIIEQIDRDVMRTHPDMHFFSGDTPSAKSNQEALKNVLIVFAKLNPGIRYVQGMNEILAPLFYIFKNDSNEENAVHAEADSFFCFVELLSGFRDNFCQQLDNSIVGIRSTITKLSQLLKEHDEELWRHLEITTKVNPQFYAFRWITLLLTQEFNFADSIHIWDTLLSDPEGPQEILLRVCCAMLILVRRRLLAGDFTANLKLLQHYPPTNISHLLYVANKLRVRSTH